MYSLASYKTQSWLAWFLRGILILGFLFLLTRVFELQIIKGAYYRALSEENRIKEIPIKADRGKILARGGEVMEGSEFAHVTGFVGEVGPDDVGKVDPDCLEKGYKKLGQMEGKSGLQAKYNCQLTGIDGAILEEVDTMGNTLRTLGERKPIKGSDLHTTIDYNFQLEVAKILDKKGAVIATDPKGEILALFSFPSFNPKDMVEDLDNPDLPFFNRVISGTFHPGSVFKPLIALAALSEGKIDKNYSYNDEGHITLKTLYGTFTYNNWYFTQYGGREGVIDLTRAIARSTDTFFYKIGELVGPEKIYDYSHKFKLDEPTGIDLPGEVSGLIPTPDWKKKVKNENWFLGNTYHLSIGQGDVAVTPLALNMMTTAIANDGKWCAPHINAKKLNAKCEDIKLKQEHINLVKEGMGKACAAGGTGYTFFDWETKYEGGSLACKTGTAEVDEGDDTHAWFTLFSPIENPQIVLTVLVEKGGEGSKVAGPIARKIMDKWMLIQNP